MAVIDSANAAVKSLTGLHLYHGDISNCSMRVRMTLEEKGLDWTSHHLDLKKKENITDEYFAINPKGLVPALVHDGVVHVESNEIIDYLDHTYPEPPLRSTESEAELMAWLQHATSIHVTGIKPYVYATMIQKKVKKTAEEEAKYNALQKNEELKSFHSKHAGGKEMNVDDLAEPKQILKASFDKLENALSGNDWIMGDQFTLADISWVPVYFVLVGCGYPFENYPNITRWADAFSARDSYKKGILEWCPDFSKV
jgi:GST-like protein